MAWESKIVDKIKPVKTIKPNFLNVILSINRPEIESKPAEIIVTEAYKTPKLAFEISKEVIQKGTNKEIKKVCPKEEKKLNKKPKFSKRLFLFTNLNQSFIYYFFRLVSLHL